MAISQDRLEQIFKYLVVEVSMKRLASETKRMMKRMRNYGLITMAALIYAIAISLFLDPNNIAPGGITGVAILLKRFTDISVGTWNMLINIPIVILGLWKFGYKFIISTMYALIWITVFTDMLAPFGAVTNDLLIASVIGGGLMAIALAFVIKAGATTGGTDIIIKVMRLKWRHIKTNTLFLATDIVVILASWAVFRDMTVAFYAGVTVVINSVVMDYCLYGSDEAKLIYIITTSPEKIKKRILEELDITATLIEGRGAYTGERKEVVMVAMRKQMAPQAEEIVREEDKNAFMIVSSASEIFGEGYKDIMREKI